MFKTDFFSRPATALLTGLLLTSLPTPQPAHALDDHHNHASHGHSSHDYVAHTDGFHGLLGGGVAVLTGSFRHDDPDNNGAHYGLGHVSLIHKDGDHYIQFHPDFRSTRGHDSVVYVSSTARVFDKASFRASKPHSLGDLPLGKGASYVKVVGFDPAAIHSVTVWCDSMDGLITSASLTPAF